MVLLDPEKKKIVRVAPDGSVTEHADVAQVAGGMANDMLVAPTGHAYVGNFGFDILTEDPRPTNLAHVTPAGRCAGSMAT